MVQIGECNKFMKTVGRIFKIVLIVIAVIVLAVCIIIAVNMPRNVRVMNRALDAAVEEIQQYADITEEDPGEYKELRLFGIMKFRIRQYEVEGIGNLSTMTMNAGLMQMSTIILTPLDRDMPLISTDYMYILGNRTSYLECYDLVLDKGGEYDTFLNELKDIKSEYADLDTITPGSAWYDSMRTVGIYMKGKRKDDDREEKALTQWIEAAMKYASDKPELSPQEKEEKLPLLEEYVTGLVDQGGVSTDFFVKALGKEKTRDLFERVLFGTKN